MPKHKKNFINRKTATSFLLVERSHQDKYAGDPDAPQHVLKDVSRKKQQRKYGVFFDDDYDYLQHLRQPFSAEAESAVDMESDSDLEEVEEKEKEEKKEEEEEEEEEEITAAEQAEGAIGLRIHEELMGFDDPVYEGRDIVLDEEVDEDILEAMMRAEAGEEEEEDDGEEFPDDFVRLASCAAPEEDEEFGGMSARQQALVNHYFESLGDDEAVNRLSRFAVGDSDDELEEDEPDVVQELRAHRLRAQKNGEDYHSQCLSLQIEKIVEDAVSYDVDEIRSRLSGVSCALTESMKQAIDTDKRIAEKSLVRDPDSLMTSEEKAENVARTLAIIREDEDTSEEETEDPVQAWADFDRRPRVTTTIDSDRVGYEPIDSVLGSCTVHPAAVSLRKNTTQRARESTEDRPEEPRDEEEEQEEIPAVPTTRQKGETAEEKRQRKAAVKAQQRSRRAAKKENKLSFKSEVARQRAAATNSTVVQL